MGSRSARVTTSTASFLAAEQVAAAGPVTKAEAKAAVGALNKNRACRMRTNGTEVETLEEGIAQ